MARFNNAGVAVPLAYGADWSARQMHGDELVDHVDSAFGRVRVEFTLRYADFPGQGHAVLTREEYESHLRVGIRSWLIYQRFTRDPDGGHDGGRDYGHAAVAYAQKIGYHRGEPIFATADRPAGEFNLDTAEAFFRGFAEVVREAGYLAGGYGFWDVVYRLQDRGVVDVLWLCGDQRGWREGIHLYQWNNGRIFPGRTPVETDLCMQFEEIGGNAVSVQDVFNAFAAMAAGESDEARKAAEDLRRVLVHYEMPKAPDTEIRVIDEESGETNATSIHAETAWQTPNFERLAALIESRPGVGLPVEGDGEISDANARKVAEFVVAELKKEGN